MATSFSLKMLLDLAQNQSDAAARRLGQLNSQEQGAEQKLRLLLAYRHDYQVRFQDLARNGIDQAGWRNFMAFMGRLDAAIAEQRKAVTTTRNCKEAGRNEWRAQQRKLKSFDTLSQRHKRAEFLRAAKHEQREQDEHAAKSAAHGRVAAEHD
jgi:flagellar FliJ protein